MNSTLAARGDGKVTLQGVILVDPLVFKSFCFGCFPERLGYTRVNNVEEIIEFFNSAL